MGKKLRIYERFLLAIAMSADSLIDFWQEGREAKKIRHYFSPWAPLGYKPSNIYQTCNRMLKTGYIEKVIKNNKPYLRLTSKANEKLKRDFPITKMQNKKWDGKWRIVIFDISEESRYIRDSLRFKLKELGFGMLQKSIYISPYDFVADMYEFLQSKKLLGKVFILTAKHELMGDPKDLADYVWKVDKIQEKYEELWMDILEIEKSKNKIRAINKIKNNYLELILKDPCLPADLLPADWMGEKVKKIIASI